MIDDLQKKIYVIYNHESVARSNMVCKNRNVADIKYPDPTKQLEVKHSKKSKKEKRHWVVTIHIAQSKSKLNYSFFYRKMTKFRKISLNLQRFFTKTLDWTSFSMRKKDYIWIMYKWATIHKNSVYKTLHLFTLQTSNTWGLT